MNGILLAIDGSDHSERAARVAGELSGGLGVPVDVVNVVSESTLVTTGPIQGYARAEKIAISQRELLRALGADLVVMQPTSSARPAVTSGRRTSSSVRPPTRS